MGEGAHDDIVHVVLLDALREVDIDLDAVLRVLGFDGVQERVEPLCCSEVADDPCEVHLQAVREVQESNL